MRPETTLRADRFAPISVYQLHRHLVLSHKDHPDTIELEPVAEADLLDYLLSRQADRVKAAPPPDCVAANLLAIALGKLTTEQLCEAVAQAKRVAE